MEDEIPALLWLYLCTAPWIIGYMVYKAIKKQIENPPPPPEGSPGNAIFLLWLLGFFDDPKE